MKKLIKNNILSTKICTQKVDLKSTMGGGINPLFHKALEVILGKNKHIKSSKIVTMFFMCFFILIHFLL